MAQYTANMNGANGQPGPTTWDYRATAPNTQGPWYNVNNTSSSVSFTEASVGSYDVRATTQFQDGTTSAIITNVTISGPDRDVITTGVNVASAGAYLTVTFEVRNGATPMGPNTVNGYPQERIRRPQYNQDSGFQNGDQNYYLTGNRAIIDNKYVNFAIDPFLSCPVGGVFDDMYQQNRMVIKDGFGVDQFFYFAERHFQKIKMSSNSWELVEVQ